MNKTLYQNFVMRHFAGDEKVCFYACQDASTRSSTDCNASDRRIWKFYHVKLNPQKAKLVDCLHTHGLSDADCNPHVG